MIELDPYIGKVMPFRMDGLPWVFDDLRRLERRRIGPAINVLQREVQAFADLGDSGRGVLCDLDTAKQRQIRARYQAEVARIPSLTWDEFRLSGGTVVEETDQKPWLPHLTLFARDMKYEIVGGIAIGNIMIESGKDAPIRATAFPGPGLPSADDKSRAQVIGHALCWLLANNLVLDNGKEIDLVGWDFPHQASARWDESGNPALVQVFDEVCKVADRSNIDGDPNSAKSLRRKGE